MDKNVIKDPKKRMLVFINIMIATIASSMLATALTTALPPIVKDLNISITMGQWLTSGYSLAMAIMMPLTAFLINRFPTKKLYCSAIIIFIVGLMICCMAPTFPIMMIGRIVQASGNGILTSMAQVITLSIFPSEKKGSAMGWYGLSVGAAPVIAPTIAGIMVDQVGWRMIFVAAAVIMVIGLVYAIAVLGNVLDNEAVKFDISSFVLSAIAFGGVTLGIGNIGNYGLIGMQTYIPLILGIVGSVLFVRKQMQLKEPFLDVRILSNRNYAISVIGSMLLYFIMMGSSILLPLYVQQVKGLSATTSGLVALPGSLAMAIISPFAGKLFDKLGIKILLFSGSVCLIVSNLCMYFITQDTSVWFAAVFNVVRSVAIGCLMMPLVTWGAGSIDARKTSHATALLTSLRTISGAIGSAVFVAVMTVATSYKVKQLGDDASMYGMNVAFATMAASSLLLFAVAVVVSKDKKSKKEIN
ncbi:MAG: multidrug efflux MFS transporter [Lachnospiraceae bacterium]|nr:multidrug efflux MFS transporter [Lachnospiraceae bacterium]